MRPPLNKVWSYINTCAAVIAGTWAELRSDCRTELINITPNPSATIKNPSKFSQNGIAKKRSIQPSLRNVTKQLDYISQNKQCANNYNDQRFSYLCQGKKCIPSFSIGSHLHQNPKTYFMSPEEIRLLFTNFPLVGISQHYANSITVFRHNIYFHQ